MARRFTLANSDFIQLALGAVLGFGNGGTKITAIFRLASLGLGNNLVIFSAGTSNTVGWALQVDSAGHPSIRCDGTAVEPSPFGTFVLSTGHWYFIRVAKTSGTTTPSWHIYDYTTQTWTHVAASAPIADSTDPPTRCQIGCDATQTTRFFDGDIALVSGEWGGESLAAGQPLSESIALVPTMQNFEAWLPQQTNRSLFLRPHLILPADPSVALVDYSGNGSNQSAISGTTATPDEMPYLVVPGLDDSRVASRT